MFILWVIVDITILYADISDNLVSLEGPHRFRPGDNPLWSLPKYDDSGWTSVQVPGSWQSQGIRPDNGMGWYRIHFEAPEGLRQIQPAVSLGVINNADEVYLNGVKIGGEGAMEKGFVLVYPPYVYRVYKIPEGLLRFNRSNLLAVRVMNNYLEGGIVSGTVLIGDYPHLMVEKISRESLKISAEFSLLAVLTIFFFATLMFYVKSGGDSTYLYFGAILLVYATQTVSESLFFYQLGCKTILVQKISFMLLPLLAGLFTTFFIKFFRESFTTFYRYAVISIFFSSVTFFFLYTSKALSFLIFLWFVITMASFGICLFITINAVKRRVNEAVPVLLGALAFGTAGAVCDFPGIFGSGGMAFYYPLTLWDYGMLFFLMCLIYAMAGRFIRTKERMQLLSSKILSAHEQERERLARELHDGLGQDLLAVKFNLQRVNQRLDNPDIRDIIQEMGRCNNELKDISMGLRPALLAEMGIEAAIRLFGTNFSRRTGIAVEVDARAGVRPPTIIEDNLFRIFQEALNNISRHSGAKKVNVCLKTIPGRLVMEIRDDGVGFESKRSGGAGGMGLSTISERVSLMEGTLRLRSAREMGTSIRVEVPL